MSKIFWLSGASPHPKKPFDPGAGSLDQRVLVLCGDDKVDSPASGTWQPYIDRVKQKLPGVTLVFDKFHLIQHLLQAVDEVRREEAPELKKTNPELLQRSRCIWLKNPENLSDKQRARLGRLEKLHLSSNRTYLLQEIFREFWNYKRKGWAKRFLKKWFWWATHGRLKPMRDFAWMLRRHQEDILSYFEMRLDNGAVEGMNNKAKVVSHRCYGFRTASNCSVPLSRQTPRTGIGAQICVRNRKKQCGFRRETKPGESPPPRGKSGAWRRRATVRAPRCPCCPFAGRSRGRPAVRRPARGFGRHKLRHRRPFQASSPGD